MADDLSGGILPSIDYQGLLSGGDPGIAPSSTSTLSGVNDLFKTLGTTYIQSLAVEKANPAAYSAYAWNAATGNTNGALMQPYVQTVAQQQQIANQSAMTAQGRISVSWLIVAAVAAYIILHK